MPTSPSSSSSTTSYSSSSSSGVVSRSASTEKLTNTSSNNTHPLLNSSSTLSVPFVRGATFVSIRVHPQSLPLLQVKKTTVLNSAFNSSHLTYLLPLQPPLVDFGCLFVVEQFTLYAKPRQHVTVKTSLERCGQSMEARITAMHRRGHMFSMERRRGFRIACAASLDGRVASMGMSVAAVVSFVPVLNEILEGVAVGGMNVARRSAPKTCSSASLPISKAAFNRDEDEDGDTLLVDKVSSDDWRLSVPARARSSLSPSPPTPQKTSLSSSVN